MNLLKELTDRTRQGEGKRKWKAEKLKGCACPTESRANPNCPVHGTKYPGKVTEAIKNIGYYTFYEYSGRAQLFYFRDKEYRLEKGDIVGIRPSSNAKAVRMIMMKLGEGRVFTITTHEQDAIIAKSKELDHEEALSH